MQNIQTLSLTLKSFTSRLLIIPIFYLTVPLENIILDHLISPGFSPQSNGWDANEMFRYNEVKYGVTSTYDSSLSMYT